VSLSGGICLRNVVLACVLFECAAIVLAIPDMDLSCTLKSQVFPSAWTLEERHLHRAKGAELAKNSVAGVGDRMRSATCFSLAAFQTAKLLGNEEFTSRIEIQILQHAPYDRNEGESRANIMQSKSNATFAWKSSLKETQRAMLQ